jgi:hypothetical protein
MVDCVAVDVPPSITEGGFLKRYEAVHVAEIVQRPIPWPNSSIEIAQDEEWIVGIQRGDLNESIQKHFHLASGFRGHVNNPEAESVRRNRDLKPEAGIVQRGNPRTPGVDRCFRENAHKAWSKPFGVVQISYSRPTSLSDFMSGPAVLGMNSISATMSGLCALMHSAIRWRRRPPPCWMFQMRSFTTDLVARDDSQRQCSRL